MNESDVRAILPPICQDCGHRASLHHLDGCRALLLGRGGPSRTCGCTTTLREILGARFPRQPAELRERDEQRSGV
ncbi:MAG TPA: hypothetical protein VE591_00795 [Candidatus Acidoferrum sp.]|nr:hypothetical protein [Candidatus Acidoferrum sp.]